ncbi:MAG: hypothetical protein EOP06_30515 [Proteobacteria bacterium]|nr:MAG: hypothetical protein EOP06_30515 [Pseudomonadota bacterium]
MQRILLSALTVILGSIIAQPAHALFDVRLTYGLLASKPDLGRMYTGLVDQPSLTPTHGLGADIIVSPPLFPIGFGLRYEDMGVDASTDNAQFKAKYTRTAALVNYRLFDTLLYIGPIFSLGLSHAGDITVHQAGVETSKFTSDKMSSYTIGLEGGAKLIGLRVGAEVGYEDFRWADAKDSHGTAATQDINMSGYYSKITVGFGL